jgi:hypothetical protein
MIQFIEDHRADLGVEPIRRVLPIAPATFYDHLAKRVDPSRLSDRAVRDADLKPEIERVFEANLSVCGVREIWRQMRREGFDIARCTVARLMKGIGIEGVIRGEKPRTTLPDKALPCPLDRAYFRRKNAFGEPPIPCACAKRPLPLRRCKHPLPGDRSATSHMSRRGRGSSTSPS